MQAIVRKGNGEYYVSAVYGYYSDIFAEDVYERYLQSIHNPYWIVWNEEKTRLIRCLAMTPGTRYLIPQIVIIDADQSDWIMDDCGVGCVSYLSRELLDSFLDEAIQPAAILDKCRALDDGYTYHEIQDIKSQKDIDNLEWASGGFHDAYIDKEILLEDGTLYLLFDGTWGCKIEVWFDGDLEYDSSSRHMDGYDDTWLDSAIFIRDGFVYLVDDAKMTAEDIQPGYCYFKARHMRYHIIPD